jgi:hypothetical protein
VSVLSLPSDNGTWGVALVASAADPALRAVTDVGVWSDVLRTMPLVAHWLDGEPLEDRIQVMAKIEDRHRSFVIDGQPVATGVVSLADSWACTNPSLGRGITMATLHALALRDLLRDSTDDDPRQFARAFHDVTMDSVEPWYRATVAVDRHRLADIDARVKGESYVADDPAYEIGQALSFAAGQDPDCLRAFLSIVGMLQTPAEALARPGVFDTVVALGDRWRREPALGPDRDELLAVLSR